MGLNYISHLFAGSYIFLEIHYSDQFWKHYHCEKPTENMEESFVNSLDSLLSPTGKSLMCIKNKREPTMNP